VACHVSSGPNGLPEFPLPWAATSDHSFLASDEETKRDFASAGFEITVLRDTTQMPTMLAMMRHKLEQRACLRSDRMYSSATNICSCWSTRCAQPNRGECGRLRSSLNDAPKSICVSGGSSENAAPRRYARERLDASAHRADADTRKRPSRFRSRLSFEAFSTAAARKAKLAEGGSASFKFTESFMSEHYSIWGVLLRGVECYLRKAVK
jgi:hypothetical protein